MQAVAGNINPQILAYLIKCGADIFQEDKKGLSAAHYWARNGGRDSFNILMRAGADFNIQVDTNLTTPVHIAAVMDQVENLKILADKIVFSNKISISFTDNEFEIQGLSSDIISYLLQMADNGLIQKFTLSVLHLESGIYYLKVWVNKT